MMKRLKLTVLMLACVFAASAQEDESKGYIVKEVDGIGTKAIFLLFDVE